jgi:hypothetical protein
MIYDALYRRWGETAAFWGAAVWYATLLLVLALSFAAPAGEFRYGSL